MTGTRIRWYEGSDGVFAWLGLVGDIGEASLVIFTPHNPGGEHYLASRLPGQENRKHCGAPEDLKAEAERWLEEYVTSLGTVFPEMIAERLSAFAHRVEALEDSDQAAGALTDLACMDLADGIGEVDRTTFREIILARFPDAEG